VPRLFVAVWPPDDVLDLMAALDRPALAGLRWTTPDQWHVTLRFLGPVPEVGPVVAAMAGLTGAPAATAVAGPAVGRFGQRILQVPVAGLGPLAGDVVGATAHLGRPPDARPFAGHLTLARASKGAAVDLRPLTGAAVAGRWTVGELCLVESRLAATGAQYSVIERFRLAAADR
jgi:2'-5' RNA ligase